MSTVLEVQNLNYKNVLNNVSFKLEEGTFNYLIGPNGSGKTTLVKCLIRLINYDGQIIYLNSIINDSNINQMIKNFGIVSEFNTLFNESVLYNITYPLINLKYSEFDAKNKAYSIAKKLKIGHLLTKNIDEISRAEKKIVSLAVSLVHNPSLIIIDDNLNELDYKTKKVIIQYLKKTKSTVILVTNNYIDIDLDKKDDRILFLNNGQIISKTIEEALKEKNIFIKNNYKTPFMLDLSNKLIFYELIDNIILNKEELINKLWK